MIGFRTVCRCGHWDARRELSSAVAISKLGSSLLIKVVVLIHYPVIIRLGVKKVFVLCNVGTLLKALHPLKYRKVERNGNFAQPIVSSIKWWRSTELAVGLDHICHSWPLVCV